MYSANIPLGYYGNAIFAASATSKSKDLCEKPLAYAVELVKAAKDRMNIEYMRSVVDFLALGGHPRADALGFFFVTDARFFGLSDFGWGSPVYQVPVVKIPMLCYLTKYKDVKGQEMTFVMMNLPPPLMNGFEQELGKIMATTTSSSLSKL